MRLMLDHAVQIVRLTTLHRLETPCAKEKDLK